MKTAVRTRVATLEDVEGVWNVCRRNLETYRQMPLTEFEAVCRHRHERNPGRTPAHPFGWVLETAEDRIVGFLGLVPMRYWIGDAERLSASGCSWAVEAEHRAHSLRLYREYMKWADGRFLVDVSASAIAAQVHRTTKMGMKPIPIPDFCRRYVWILKIRPVAAACTRLISRRLGNAALCRFIDCMPVRACIYPFLLLRFARKTALPGNSHGLTVEPVRRFQDEFDALWKTIRSQYRITLVRTSDFLNWRLIDMPESLPRAFALACRENGVLKGYAVVHVRPAENVSGRFVLSDIFYDRRRKDVLTALLHHAYLLARSRDAAVFEISSFHPDVMSVARSAFPMRTTEATVCSYWFKASDPGIADVCTGGDWWPSGLDGDANM